MWNFPEGRLKEGLAFNSIAWAHISRAIGGWELLAHVGLYKTSELWRSLQTKYFSEATSWPCFARKLRHCDTVTKGRVILWKRTLNYCKRFLTVRHSKIPGFFDSFQCTTSHNVRLHDDCPWWLLPNSSVASLLI